MNNTALPEQTLVQAVIVNVASEQPRNSVPQNTSSFRKLCARFRVSYLVDICILVTAFTLMGLIEFGYIPNTKLGFICKDPALSYPFRGETVSGRTLMATALFSPMFIITLIEILREKSFKKVCVWTLWNYYKECLIGMFLVLFIAEVAKVIVGEQRPHFLDSCEPDTNRNCQPGTFILDYNCTNTRISEYFKADITRSFPSGHTSISLFVALYLSYLIHNRIATANVSKLTKPFLMSICLTWCLVCSLTRITDRRHHWWDVLAGAFLGTFGAMYSVFLLHRREQQTLLLDVKNNIS